MEGAMFAENLTNWRSDSQCDAIATFLDQVNDVPMVK